MACVTRASSVRPFFIKNKIIIILNPLPTVGKGERKEKEKKKHACCGGKIFRNWQGTCSVLPSPLFDAAGIVPGESSPPDVGWPVDTAHSNNAGYGSHPKVLLCSPAQTNLAR